MKMITIDGSENEGGGQILRTALTLSLHTGMPFRIENIRGGRQKPGLMRQHLAAVKAAAEIGSASVQGGELGSRELVFTPEGVTPGEYNFAVGTAGSALLVLQTVLPVLMLASKPSFVTVEGGTHNSAAPPYDFIERAYLPLINRIGARVRAELLSAGFYPAGGGMVKLAIEPAAELKPLELITRGAPRRRLARAIVANLTRRIAERELAVTAQRLSWEKSCFMVEEIRSRGPGNVLFLEVESDNITEVFTGFGERGVAAEAVAENAVAAARRYLAVDAAVGEHLADQILVPLALAKGGVFTTLPPTRHTHTNIATLGRFLPVKARLTSGDKRVCTIEIAN
jgi:RNA 3'-terminal phosphate cyclase (ATP)